jgi:hypothetical protein
MENGFHPKCDSNEGPGAPPQWKKPPSFCVDNKIQEHYVRAYFCGHMDTHSAIRGIIQPFNQTAYKRLHEFMIWISLASMQGFLFYNRGTSGGPYEEGF